MYKGNESYGHNGFFQTLQRTNTCKLLKKDSHIENQIMYILSLEAKQSTF